VRDQSAALAGARHLFAWAVAEGYATETPFKRNGVTVIKLTHQAEGPRTRRLQPGTPGRPGQPAVPGEEERLLKHADPRLRALIVAALSTGCRRDELLSLTWRQVKFDDQGIARALVLEAAHTKTNKDVRDFLGHANITATSTYLASTPVRLARALDRLDPEPAPPGTRTSETRAPIMRTQDTPQSDLPSAPSPVTH
jgi:integrase